MYHHIAPNDSVPRDPSPGEGWNYSHSPAGFENQLHELRRRGFRFVSLASMVRKIQETGREAPGSIAITLDDGWIDNYRYAFPVLRGLGVPATFFVTTAYLHNGVNDPKRMSLAQLREIQAAGMAVGGHSRSHPNLTKLRLTEAAKEVAGCKEDLEQALGSRVEVFAYPGGVFNRAVAAVVQDAGYIAACSILGLGINRPASVYWLYRDLLSKGMATLGDWCRLNSWARYVLHFRTERRLRDQLSGFSDLRRSKGGATRDSTAADGSVPVRGEGDGFEA